MKIKELAKKWLRLPAAIMFFALIFAITLADVFSPDKLFDENENRTLSQAPAFSIESLMETAENRKYTYKYEQYVNDQFIFRPEWIGLKSRLEWALLKTENNGVAYGKDGFQFEKWSVVDEMSFTSHLQAVRDFAKRYEGRVNVMLVPGAQLILSDKLPNGLPTVDENALLDSARDQLEPYAYVCDVREPLLNAAADGEYIFYRTDHHWTTDGAYRAYLRFASQKGFEPFDIDAAKKTDVPGFLGTHFNKSLHFDSIPDVLSYYQLENKLSIQNLDMDSEPLTHDDGGLYNFSALEKRDKYAMFLRGNNAYSTISGDDTHDKRILVLKDSYANCFVPFLTANYAQIDVVDLRFLRSGVESLIEKYDYDDILILYSLKSFAGVEADGLKLLPNTPLDNNG